MDILAENLRDELRFYSTIDPIVKGNSFGQDETNASRAATNLLNIVQTANDDEALSRYQALFAPYLTPPSTQQQTPALKN